MLKYLFKNSDASINLNSYKAPTEIIKNGYTMYINSLELIWNVAGTPDGEFDIILSNDKYSDSIVKNIVIDSADNRSNSKMIKLYPFSEYIGVNYKPNSISSGKITVCINYSANNFMQSSESISLPDIT